MTELVVGVHDPETRGVDVGVEKGVGHPGEDSEVVLDDVVHLDSVLQEECEALDVVGNVVLNGGVGDVVKGAGSVVRVVDRVASHVAGVHVSSDVEVDRIPLRRKSIEFSTIYANLPSNPEGLSNTRQLSVADSCFNKPLVLVLGTEKKIL